MSFYCANEHAVRPRPPCQEQCAHCQTIVGQTIPSPKPKPQEVWYLCGPMSNIAGFNYATFDATASKLRARGVQVMNPPDFDPRAIRELAAASPDGDVVKFQEQTGMTYGTNISSAVKAILDDGVTGMVCLPGWQQSNGARIETFVARLLGLPVYLWYGEGVWPLPLATTRMLQEAHDVH